MLALAAAIVLFAQDPGRSDRDVIIRDLSAREVPGCAALMNAREIGEAQRASLMLTLSLLDVYAMGLEEDRRALNLAGDHRITVARRGVEARAQNIADAMHMLDEQSAILEYVWSLYCFPEA